MKETTKIIETTDITDQTQEKTRDTQLNIHDYATHPRTEEFDLMVAKYFEKTQDMPFVDIQMTEDDSGQINIDMKDDFHEEALKQFGGDLDEILGDYVTSLIKSAMEDMSEEDMIKMAEDFALQEEAKEAKESQDETEVNG